MSLADKFDGVLMLTWSDWDTEPRSNRYHYATRFARHLPVLFFQHKYEVRDVISIRSSGIENIDIVDVSCELSVEDLVDIKKLLFGRGIKRPLIWIYDSIYYQPLIDVLSTGFLVYHATEDYLIETAGWNQSMDPTRESVIRLLAKVHMMVACSEGVARSIQKQANYLGPCAVVENGCDAEYFISLAQKYYDDKEKDNNKHIAIFQGGINQRLDYPLLLQIIRNMPDWDFRFCGSSVQSQGWQEILEQPNVRHFGMLSPDDVTKHMCKSTIGLIPYIQDQWIYNSLPLKAFEYIACGLPVVSVPIEALERYPDHIAISRTAKEFEISMRSMANTRHDTNLLNLRREAALSNSYNKRFSAMCDELLTARYSFNNSCSKLKIALLYDSMVSMHVNTISEHLEAFNKYSRHHVSYISVNPEYWKRTASETETMVDLSIFDVVIVHYSTRLSVIGHLDEGIARVVEKYCGLKILFIQDEYEGTEIARAWIERLRFDVVYTCVPKESQNYVYPPYRFPATEFIHTLTGYVPETQGLEQFAKPLKERELMIAYRGRKLPPIYGQLGYEKFRIGVDIKIIAGLRGLPVDIEVDETKRIYGPAWYKFLGSARVTLGTESGANIFDFDGTIQEEIDRLVTANPGGTFEEIFSRVLAPHEGMVRMNQISPKIFESIRLRTALVLFEGEYSGVVIPHKHYIPLKKDFSNIDEVFAKIQDDEYLEKITELAYQDVITSGQYSYKNFINKIDLDIEKRVLNKNTTSALRSVFVLGKKDGALRQALPAIPLQLEAGAHPLGRPLSSAEVTGIIPEEYAKIMDVFKEETESRIRAEIESRLRAEIAKEFQSPTLLYRIAKRIWRLIPRYPRTAILMVARRIGIRV